MFGTVKRVLLCIVFIGLITVNVCIAQVSNSIKITGLSQNYSFYETITFQVESLIEDPLEFTCSIEKSDNDEWQEIIYSCDWDSPMKATLLHKLPPLGSRTITWEPQKEKYGTFSDGLYRFRLDFKDKSSQNTFVLHSPTFMLKEN